MTVAAPWVRGVFELAERRRIRQTDLQEAVRVSIPACGETILTSGMSWRVDGRETPDPLGILGQRVEVSFRVVVVRGAEL